MTINHFKKIAERLDVLESRSELNPRHVILTNKECQELLKVSPKTLQKWRDNGTIRYSKIGREIFYTLDNVLTALSNKSILNGES